MDTVRAFIAITLGSDLTARLETLQDQLRAQLLPRAVRWVQPRQIHLTLKFLGNVPTGRLEALFNAFTQACAGTAPFELRAGALGCFPNLTRPRVIWVGVEGDLDVLRTLQTRIDAAARDFATKNEAREWHPHLTIGRVADARGRELRRISEVLSATKFEEKTDSWPVRSVELMQSTLSPRGSVYTCLKSVKL